MPVAPNGSTNWYWTVLDNNPSTEVFSSYRWFNGTSPYYVSVLDADYLFWLSIVGAPTIIATNDSVLLLVNSYLQAAMGTGTKLATRAATTANITLSGTQTIDGIALAVGDRVLVKDQSAVATNGIYIVQSGAWVRSGDTNTAQQLVGAMNYVRSGSANAGTMWVSQFPAQGVLGTDNVIWRWYAGNWTPADITVIPAASIGGTEYMLASDSAAAALPPVKWTINSLAQSAPFSSVFQAKSGVVTATSSIHTLAATTTNLVYNYAGTATITLPAASAFPGREFTIQTWPAQAVVSSTNNVVAAGGGVPGTAILAATAGKWAKLVSNSSASWYIMAYN